MFRLNCFFNFSSLTSIFAFIFILMIFSNGFIFWDFWLVMTLEMNLLVESVHLESFDLLKRLVYSYTKNVCCIVVERKSNICRHKEF